MTQQQLTAVGAPAKRRRLPPPEPLGVLGVAGVGVLIAAGPLLSDAPATGAWLLIPLLMLTAVPLVWVSRAPMIVLLLVIALQAVAFTMFHAFRLPDAEFALIAVAIALGVVTARRPLWMSLIAVLVSWSFAMTVFLLEYRATDLLWLVQSTAAMCLLAWGLGLLAHANRRRLARVRAEHARAAQAVAEERARIAAELNGIISVDVERMRQDAQVAARAIGDDHPRARAALAAVEATGVEAMNELRRLLHVLRDDPAFALDDDGADPAGEVATGDLARRSSGVTPADMAVTAAAMLASAAIAVLSIPGADRWAVGAYVAVTTLALLWRRRFPLAVFVFVIAAHAGAVVLFHHGDFVWDAFLAGVPVLVALFAVAGRSTWWVSALALLAAWVYLSVPALAYPFVLVQNIASYGLIVVSVWAAGAYAGKRRRQIAELETTQDAAAHAVAQERAKLAYDLHDVIGHSITVMVVQAAGARRILDRDPERAAAALTAVAHAGAEASAELERFVQLLSGSGSPTAVGAPTKGLADIEELVDRAGASVDRIDVAVSGSPFRLEPSVDLAGYCVVREALANAIKHDGPGAQVTVAIAWAEHEVGVRVVSRPGDAERPHAGGLSGGYGLVGVRERVRVAGGRVEWASGEDSFTVAARLPVADRA